MDRARRSPRQAQRGQQPLLRSSAFASGRRLEMVCVESSPAFCFWIHVARICADIAMSTTAIASTNTIELRSDSSRHRAVAVSSRHRTTCLYVSRSLHSSLSRVMFLSIWAIRCFPAKTVPELKTLFYSEKLLARKSRIFFSLSSRFPLVLAAISGQCFETATASSNQLYTVVDDLRVRLPTGWTRGLGMINYGHYAGVGLGCWGTVATEQSTMLRRGLGLGAS